MRPMRSRRKRCATRPKSARRWRPAYGSRCSASVVPGMARWRSSTQCTIASSSAPIARDMLKIWGRLSSVNVQKVVWCCDELGLAYERVDAGGAFGLNDTPQYLAMNPNGLVPVIEDEGFILYESNAITRYLAAKHGTGTLWPGD